MNKPPVVRNRDGRNHIFYVSKNVLALVHVAITIIIIIIANTYNRVLLHYVTHVCVCLHALLYTYFNAYIRHSPTAAAAAIRFLVRKDYNPSRLRNPHRFRPQLQRCPRNRFIRLRRWKTRSTAAAMVGNSNNNILWAFNWFAKILQFHFLPENHVWLHTQYLFAGLRRYISIEHTILPIHQSRIYVVVVMSSRKNTVPATIIYTRIIEFRGEDTQSTHAHSTLIS